MKDDVVDIDRHIIKSHIQADSIENKEKYDQIKIPQDENPPILENDQQRAVKEIEEEIYVINAVKNNEINDYNSNENQHPIDYPSKAGQKEKCHNGIHEMSPSDSIKQHKTQTTQIETPIKDGNELDKVWLNRQQEQMDSFKKSHDKSVGECNSGNSKEMADDKPQDNCDTEPKMTINELCYYSDMQESKKSYGPSNQEILD